MTSRLSPALAVGLALFSCCLASPLDAGQGPTPSTPDMYRPKPGASRTLLPDGRVLHLGGTDRNLAVADAAIEDPDTGQVFRLASTMGTARTGHTATVLADGTVLIVGGVTRRGEPAGNA